MPAANKGGTLLGQTKALFQQLQQHRSDLIWGLTLSKKLLGKFNNHILNRHCQRADEFQIQNLRKALDVTGNLY